MNLRLNAVIAIDGMPFVSVERQRERKHGTRRGALYPDASLMPPQDQSADCQTQPPTRTILSSGIRRVFLKNLVQMRLGDARTRVPDIYAERVRQMSFCHATVDRSAGIGKAPRPTFPEEWIGIDLDTAVSRCELTGIVEQVDEDLLHLRAFKQ